MLRPVFLLLAGLTLAASQCNYTNSDSFCPSSCKLQYTSPTSSTSLTCSNTVAVPCSGGLCSSSTSETQLALRIGWNSAVADVPSDPQAWVDNFVSTTASLLSMSSSDVVVVSVEACYDPCAELFPTQQTLTGSISILKVVFWLLGADASAGVVRFADQAPSSNFASDISSGAGSFLSNYLQVESLQSLASMEVVSSLGGSLTPLVMQPCTADKLTACSGLRLDSNVRLGSGSLVLKRLGTDVVVSTLALQIVDVPDGGKLLPLDLTKAVTLNGRYTAYEVVQQGDALVVDGSSTTVPISNYFFRVCDNVCIEVNQPATIEFHLSQSPDAVQFATQLKSQALTSVALLSNGALNTINGRPSVVVDANKAIVTVESSSDPCVVAFDAKKSIEANPSSLGSFELNPTSPQLVVSCTQEVIPTQTTDDGGFPMWVIAIIVGPIVVVLLVLVGRKVMQGRRDLHEVKTETNERKVIRGELHGLDTTDLASIEAELGERRITEVIRAESVAPGRNSTAVVTQEGDFDSDDDLEAGDIGLGDI